MEKCQLSNLWKHESEGVQAIQTKQSVTLSCVQEIEDILDLFKKNPEYPSEISELTLIDCIETPFLTDLLWKIKSTLSTLKIKNIEITQQGYTDLMISLVGSNITHLIIHLESESNLKCFPLRNIESNQLVIFPNVKSLTYCCGSNIRVPNSSLLSSVAKSFPNLVTLTLSCLVPEKPANFNGIHLKHLKTLSIGQDSSYDSPITNDLLTNNLDCLFKLNLDLNRLEIHNVNKHINKCIFKKFLESQRKLKELVLIQRSIQYYDEMEDERYRRYFSLQPEVFIFPLGLSSLTYLCVTKLFVRNLNHVFDSCTNVQQMFLDFHKNSDWNSILRKGKPLSPPPYLTSLEIGWIDPISFKMIASSPLGDQITWLCLYQCSDALLQVVFEKFLNLETLIVWDLDMAGIHMGMTDSSFSGLNQEILSKLDPLHLEFTNFIKYLINDLATCGDTACMNCISSLYSEEFVKPMSSWLKENKDKFNIRHNHIGNLKNLSLLEITLSPSSSIKKIPMWGIETLPKLSTITLRGLEDRITIFYLGIMGYFIFSDKGDDESDNDYTFVKDE